VKRRVETGVYGAAARYYLNERFVHGGIPFWEERICCLRANWEETFLTRKRDEEMLTKISYAMLRKQHAEALV